MFKIMLDDDKKYYINGKYNLIEKIGSGTFGTIYKGENIRTFEKVAIKVEPVKNGTKLLKNESIIYTYLNGLKGIPNVKWFGKDNINYYMVINLLGDSLEKIKNDIGHFSLNDILKIGADCLILLQSIHSKGIIHRDIKPDNFLFGLGKVSNQIHIIDFGLAKTYIIHNKHIPLKNTKGLIGSNTYASINAHHFIELSRRDDLESLAYMLLYLYFDKLPWQDIYDKNLKKINNLICQLKINLLNDSSIPEVFVKYLRHVQSMKFEETPDYKKYIELFLSEIKISNILG